MKRFAYFFDPLFLLCCALYAANRWLIKPHVHLAFFHNWFNDTLLIPSALPPLLFVHDCFHLRPRNQWPTALEIFAHTAGWSILFEWIGPHIMHTTGDPLDVVAYFAGAAFAFLWWRIAQRIPPRHETADFNLFAPHYRWLEFLLAGSKLQRCRTAFLPAMPAPRNVLLLGEGNGRFLTELRRLHPRAQITCLDASDQMLARARARLIRLGLDTAGVNFIHADILEWSPASGAPFDLIVSHFFLDCFRADQLDQILPRLARLASPDARWLIADFREPENGWIAWRARFILRSMYLFFQNFTHIPAGELAPVDPLLARHGFTLRERRLSEWGLLHTDLWQLGPGRGTSPRAHPESPSLSAQPALAV